jgi:hypothetical protein
MFLNPPLLPKVQKDSCQTLELGFEILLNNLFDPIVSFSTLLQLAKCKAYNLHLIICKLQGMNCRVEYVYL